jgi:hypothetical protein
MTIGCNHAMFAVVLKLQERPPPNGFADDSDPTYLYDSAHLSVGCPGTPISKCNTSSRVPSPW